SSSELTSGWTDAAHWGTSSFTSLAWSPVSSERGMSVGAATSYFDGIGFGARSPSRISPHTSRQSLQTLCPSRLNTRPSTSYPCLLQKRKPPLSPPGSL